MTDLSGHLTPLCAAPGAEDHRRPCPREAQRRTFTHARRCRLEVYRRTHSIAGLDEHFTLWREATKRGERGRIGVRVCSAPTAFSTTSNRCRLPGIGLSHEYTSKTSSPANLVTRTANNGQACSYQVDARAREGSRSPDGLFAQQEREPIRGRPAVRGKRTYGGRPGQGVEEQGTWASRTQKHSEAGYGRPVDRGAWTAKTVKRPRQQPAHPQYANYWAPLTRKRHTMPHSAQPQHTNYWAP